MASSGGARRGELAPPPGAGPPLALRLLRASRWLDALLLAELVARGWPRLSPAQTLVFAYLDHDGTPPAELARRLGQTRQATAQLVAGLVRHDVLAVVDDQDRRRGRLVVLTERGRRLAGAAADIYANLERRLGLDRVEAVHTALHALPMDLDLVTPDLTARDDEIPVDRPA